MDLPLFLVMTVLVPAAGAFMVPAAGAAMAAVVGTGNVWLIAKPAFQIFLHSVVRISSNSAEELNTSLSQRVFERLRPCFRRLQWKRPGRLKAGQGAVAAVTGIYGFRRNHFIVFNRINF